MTKKEAQDLLGVSERTLDGYVKKYGLTVQYIPIRTGKRADYDAEELAQLKERLEAPQSPIPGAYAPSSATSETALAIAPQSGLALPLRPSVAPNGAQFFVIPVEDFPALAQAFGAQSQPREESVPLSERLALDLDGAAAVSGFSRGFIRDAIGKGELTANKIGRGWKINRKALEAWVDKVTG